jgi:hypothetical protein
MAITRGLRLRTLGLVVGAMVSVHGAEIDELMVDTVVGCGIDVRVASHHRVNHQLVNLSSMNTHHGTDH